MQMLTGFASRGGFVRTAAVSALGAATLAALSVAEPAKSADLEYRYSERYDYQVPVAPERHSETREYRVIVQPVKRRHERHGYSPALPPRGYSEGYYEEEYEYQPAEIAPRHEPRVVYRETVVEESYSDVPYRPYGAVEVEPVIPPAPVGPPPSRW